MTKTMADFTHTHTSCFHYLLNLVRLENNTTLASIFPIETNAILAFYLSQWLSDIFSRLRLLQREGMNANHFILQKTT